MAISRVISLQHHYNIRMSTGNVLINKSQLIFEKLWIPLFMFFSKFSAGRQTKPIFAILQDIAEWCIQEPWLSYMTSVLYLLLRDMPEMTRIDYSFHFLLLKKQMQLKALSQV